MSTRGRKGTKKRATTASRGSNAWQTRRWCVVHTTEAPLLMIEKEGGSDSVDARGGAERNDPRGRGCSSCSCSCRSAQLSGVCGGQPASKRGAATARRNTRGCQRLQHGPRGRAPHPRPVEVEVGMDCSRGGVANPTQRRSKRPSASAASAAAAAVAVAAAAAVLVVDILAAVATIADPTD